MVTLTKKEMTCKKLKQEKLQKKSERTDQRSGNKVTRNEWRTGIILKEVLKVGSPTLYKYEHKQTNKSQEEGNDTIFHVYWVRTNSNGLAILVSLK